jgi:hypothetical protein
MKQFLESSLSRDLRIWFLITNFRQSNADKGKLGIIAAYWTALFHLRLIWALARFRPAVVYYPITATALGLPAIPRTDRHSLARWPLAAEFRNLRMVRTAVD